MGQKFNYKNASFYDLSKWTFSTCLYWAFSRFREGKNLTWLIYPLSLMKKGLLQKGNLITKYNALIDENSIHNLDFTDCDIIVLNDEYRDNYYYGKPLLINRLEEILPGKSEFER